MKILIEQFVVWLDKDGFYSDLVSTDTIEFSSHSDIDLNDLVAKLKSRYTDVILYKDNTWMDEKYSSKYSHLLEEYENIEKIELGFYVSKV